MNWILAMMRSYRVIRICMIQPQRDMWEKKNCNDNERINKMIYLRMKKKNLSILNQLLTKTKFSQKREQYHVDLDWFSKMTKLKGPCSPWILLNMTLNMPTTHPTD